MKYAIMVTVADDVWPISDEVFMPNNRDVLKIANALAEITNNDAYKKSLH